MSASGSAPAAVSAGVTWYGSVLAQGFVFDERLLGRARLLERLVTLWSDGARLARDGTRWYLVGLAPRRADSRTSPGAPLVWRDGRWLAGPLDARALSAGAVDAVFDVVGGAVRVVDLRALEQVHPADLIELESPRVLAAQPLPPPPSVVVAAPPRVEPANLDAVFAPLLAALQKEPRPQVVDVPRERPWARLVRAVREWREARAARRAAEAEARAAVPTRPESGVVVPVLLGALLVWAIALWWRSGASFPRPSPLGVVVAVVVFFVLLRLMSGSAPSVPIDPGDDPRGDGLFARFGRWLSSASRSSTASERLSRAPDSRAGENAPAGSRSTTGGDGLLSRFGRWLSREDAPDAAGSRSTTGGDGLLSRFGRWLSGASRPGSRSSTGSVGLLSRASDSRAGENAPAGSRSGTGSDGLLSRFGRWLSRENAPDSRDGEPRRSAAPAPSDGIFSRLGRWFGSTSGTAPRTEAGFFANLFAVRGRDVPPRDPPPVPRVNAPRRGFFARLFGGSTAQRAYLDDLRRRFTLGDLGEALRRAMPLSDRAGNGLPATGGVPTPRSSLSLFSPNAVGAPSMVMPPDEFAEMKKLYREAADTLVARGQIDEAAFVLAKLLNDAPAAVALLEQHGKLELAAQVATAQHLPETDRIRLWLLAGRKDEAIRIVRGSRDFGALVTALTPRAPDLARQLRVVWGDWLAERQRYTDAIVATAPLADPPAAWETWVERSLEAGGAAAATALAVDAGRHPEDVTQTRARLGALLEQDARLTSLAADALLRHAPRTKGVLHRDLWRRLMRQASDGTPIDRSLTTRVLQSADDPTLDVDAIPAAPPHPTAVRGVLEVPAPAVAGLAVLDAVVLPKRRRALAHGAAGLRIVSASGETVRHHLVKADALVTGPLGATVLVLSLDGELTRVWRLDPLTLALTNWFQGRIAAFSRRTDGLCWPVGMESSLVFLDPAAPGPMEWWRVPSFEVLELDTSDGRVSALGTDPAQRESWRLLFDVGAQQLIKRLGAARAVWASGATHFFWELKVLEDAALELLVGCDTTNLLTTRLPNAAWRTLAMEPGLVLSRVVEGNTEVSLASWSLKPAAASAPRLIARLWGTRTVALRELGPRLLGLADEHGRVTELELG